MITEAIRSYEVSLWTLQDEFITVLKWSDVEHKGTIQDPKLVLADDGTENFTFTIPMYLYENGTLVENPIWYNTRNGNLIANLRKVKIIFNKGLMDELLLKLDNLDYDTAQLIACIIGHNIHNDRFFILNNENGLYQTTEYAKTLLLQNGEIEKVFELVITKVTEEHEADHLFCNVECTGLAFNELGKIGYTISLSAADFEYKYKQWQESDMSDPMPLQNVQFWCEDCLKLPRWPITGLSANIDPRKWYYDIQMSWPSFKDGPNRDTGIVYEESYITNWKTGSSGELVPEAVEHYREKERTVEINESNIYNITQTIAETFGIFCKYIYEHDNNYHIIGRRIVFFNNYLQDENILSLTYPYSSNKVSREMDSTDTITKLYVKPIENNSTLLGYDDIRYCEANKTLENYIFNFDYLKETKSITEEQYEAIKEYEITIHNYNSEMIPLENKVNVYENQITELKSKITYYTNAIAKAEEEVHSNNDLMLNLLAEHSTISGGQYIDAFDSLHPDSAIVLTDNSGAYYINLNTHKKGIRTETVHAYRAYANNVLSDEVTNFSFEYDENNNPIRIRGIAPSNQDNSKRIYLTYSYEPKLYYEAVINTLNEKITKDSNSKQIAENELELLTNDTKDENGYPIGLKPKAEQLLDELRIKKRMAIEEFQYMMGPALREGNWTPENYQDYGERHSAEKSFSNRYIQNEIWTDTGNDFILSWDDKLFDTEQDIYYKLGLAENEQSYPCINLSNIPPNHYFWSHLNDYSFIFNNTYYKENPTQEELSNIKNIRSFKIGSEAQLGFVTYKNNDSASVFPVLILVGAKTMSTSGDGLLTGGMVGFMLDPDRGRPRLGIITNTPNNNNVITTISNEGLITITNDNKNNYYKINNTNINTTYFKAVYPRIKFSSLMLKTQDENFFIHYNGQLLKNYEDYYILNRNVDNGLETCSYSPEFYITIKPNVFLLSGSLTNTINVGYTLSNAGTSIYLDAIEIAKENAYPKVSYTVDPNILDRHMIAMLYNKLNWLVMINDAQLKLINTFGYISKLELDLDFPDKDSIEIKNYKSKFEDLFSSIVASTESMKANEGLLSSLAAGTYNISGASLAAAVQANPTAIQNVFDNYIANSSGMEEYMTELFTNASEIFTDASQTVTELESSAAANNKILSSFADKIKNEFSPTLFRQPETPTRFKAGDIWIQVDAQFNEIATYIAISNSSNSSNNGGWNRVHNGSLAQIIGTGIDADAVTGKVNITSFKYDDPETIDLENTGVFLRAYRVPITGDNIELSQVSVCPEKIDLFGSTINLMSGVGDTVSAISLSGENGIYIGASAGVKLYSGPLNGNSNVSIELMPTHLLLGASASAGTTAVKITPSAFVIASSQSEVDSLAGNTKITGILTTTTENGQTINTSLTGLKITKNSFGIAIASGNNLEAFIMNHNGITLAHNLTNISDAGESLNGANGSYVRMGGQGITISSGANITVKSGGKINIAADDLMIGSQTSTAAFRMNDGQIWASVSGSVHTKDGSSLLITESQLKLSTGTDTWIDLQSGYLDLHASNSTNIILDEAGIILNGSTININGNPIWSNDRIKYGTDEPEPPKDPGLSGKPWIWIKPNASSQWTYATQSSWGGGTARRIDFTTYNNNAGENIVSGDNTTYTYTVKCYVRSNTNVTTVNRFLSLQLTNGNNQKPKGWSKALTKTIPANTLTNTNDTVVEFYYSGTGGDNNLGDVGGTIKGTVRLSEDSSGSSESQYAISINLRRVIITVTADTASSGRFPCTVYYIQP